MQLRCVSCDKLLLEIEYKESSDQDFAVKKICERCGARNIAAIQYRAPIKSTNQTASLSAPMI